MSPRCCQFLSRRDQDKTLVCLETETTTLSKCNYKLTSESAYQYELCSRHYSDIQASVVFANLLFVCKFYVIDGAKEAHKLSGEAKNTIRMKNMFLENRTNKNSICRTTVE